MGKPNNSFHPTQYQITLQSWKVEWEKEHLEGKCSTCDGEGTVGDDDPTHQQVRKDKCPDCKGQGTKVGPIRRLINQAYFDLMFGPVGDGAYGDPAEGDESDDWKGYPGFTTACQQIKEALADLPRELYLDTETETWSDNEPQPEKCQTCDGEGSISDNEAETTTKCAECNGLGCFEPAGTWYKVEYPELLQAIVGTELASYIN